MDPALSDSAMESMTLQELEIHFVKRNPPFESNEWSLFTRPMPLVSDGTDSRQLSR